MTLFIEDKRDIMMFELLILQSMYQKVNIYNIYLCYVYIQTTGHIFYILINLSYYLFSYYFHY